MSSHGVRGSPSLASRISLVEGFHGLDAVHDVRRLGTRARGGTSAGVSHRRREAGEILRLVRSRARRRLLHVSIVEALFAAFDELEALDTGELDDDGSRGRG